MIEIIKHTLGLCGEPHGNLFLVGGSILMGIRYGLFILNEYFYKILKKNEDE